MNQPIKKPMFKKKKVWADVLSLVLATICVTNMVLFLRLKASEPGDYQWFGIFNGVFLIFLFIALFYSIAKGVDK